MMAQPERLRRVLRKFRLDQRIARLAQANAERERAALRATCARLDEARERLAVDSGPVTGRSLATFGEWADRLAASRQMLEPTIHHSDMMCTDTQHRERRAARRVEQLAERIRESERFAARKDGDTLPGGRHSRKARGESHR